APAGRHCSRVIARALDLNHCSINREHRPDLHDNLPPIRGGAGSLWEDRVTMWRQIKSHHEGAERPHAYLPWQCLNFLPEPQGQASLRPTLPHVVGSFGLRSATAVSPPAATALAVMGPPNARSSSPVFGSRWCASMNGSCEASSCGGCCTISTRMSCAVTASRKCETMASNSAKASALYSFSGSRWP